MKKLIYIVWAFCLGLQGCEQDPEYEYDDIDRIYFQYEVQNSLWNNVSVDSVVFSFGRGSCRYGQDRRATYGECFRTTPEISGEGVGKGGTVKWFDNHG